jgi:hypothetical protein
MHVCTNAVASRAGCCCCSSRRARRPRERCGSDGGSGARSGIGDAWWGGGGGGIELLLRRGGDPREAAWARRAAAQAAAYSRACAPAAPAFVPLIDVLPAAPDRGIDAGAAARLSPVDLAAAVAACGRLQEGCARARSHTQIRMHALVLDDYKHARSLSPTHTHKRTHTRARTPMHSRTCTHTTAPPARHERAGTPSTLTWTTCGTRAPAAAAVASHSRTGSQRRRTRRGVRTRRWCAAAGGHIYIARPHGRAWTARDGGALGLRRVAAQRRAEL